jgi:hypothetical protein
MTFRARRDLGGSVDRGTSHLDGKVLSASRYRRDVLSTGSVTPFASNVRSQVDQLLVLNLTRCRVATKAAFQTFTREKTSKILDVRMNPGR